ncbi:MAG: glycosyltransferase, partial [Planctomycetes bacterium]|nr:glycosyltransferase [Planctomycetota bacterium]
YGPDTLNLKARNKVALQKKLGLPVRGDFPLLGLISRLSWQKGIDLVTERFSRLPVQFVFLGHGQLRYEGHLRQLAGKYPHKFSAQIKFDEELAHLIYAGADIFLMPSRFEPCGLGQMIAMRYGTVPVVRRTGGLADTVDHRAGFSFKEVSSRVLYDTLKKAITVYRQEPVAWRKLQLNGMKRDFSWDASAKEYVKLYRKLIKA